MKKNYKKPIIKTFLGSDIFLTSGGDGFKDDPWGNDPNGTL